MNEMISQNFPMLAGVGTAITLGWGYVKQSVFYLRNILIKTVVLDTDKGNSYIHSYSVYLKSREYFKHILSFDNDIVLDSKYINGNRILFSLSSPPFFVGITNNYFPVIIKYGTSVSFTYIRGTIDIKEIINLLENYYREYEISKKFNNFFNIFDVYGSLNDKISISTSNQEAPTLAKDSVNSTTDNLIGKNGFFITGKDEYVKFNTNYNNENNILNEGYPDDIIKKVNMLKHWVNNRQWFVDRNIPWNRSIRIEGKPGSGKSTFIVSLAKYLNIPIYKFHLNTMDSKMFTEEWKRVANQSPAIILLEDFDRLFSDKREFILEKLTLDTVLNVISGANEYNGILTIITANFPEKLDPALGQIVDGKSTRPGRLDFLIEINELTETQRRNIANKILDKYPDLVENIIKIGEGETAAQFSQRCIELAQFKFEEEMINL